jgi:hypothetical protein
MMSDLDDLFAAQRARALQENAAPVPSDLMARILADAAREQPAARPISSMRSAAAPAGAGFWDGMAALFGGRGVVAGLASVACAGVFLGAVQPTALLDLTMSLSGSAAVDQLDFMPSIDALLAEE